MHFEVCPFSINVLFTDVCFSFHSTLFVHRLLLKSIAAEFTLSIWVLKQENIELMLRNVNLFVKRQSEPPAELTY